MLERRTPVEPMEAYLHRVYGSTDYANRYPKDWESRVVGVGGLMCLTLAELQNMVNEAADKFGIYPEGL